MKPAWSVRADGQDISAKLALYLVGLSISDRAGMESDELVLEVADPRAEIALPRLGARLSVAIGYAHTGLTEMGEHVVASVELFSPPRTLSIRAHAADLRGTLKERKTRGFDGRTVGQVVEQIAAEHGLQPAVELQLKSYSARRIDQTNESDISLLTRLGQLFDAIVTVKAGRLLVTRRGQGRSVSGLALPDLALTPQDVTRWRLAVTEADQAASVQARWRDMDAAETIWESAEAAQTGQGAPGSVYRIRQTFPDQASAQQAAKAKAAALTRAQTRLSITLPGSPVYGAEMPLALSRFCAELDGRWIATAVTHRIDGSGYVCEIEGERP